jgi:hypothetical protein
MAVTKTIVKKTSSEAIVKIGGTSGSATIDISADLLSHNQALSGDTVRVDIVGAMVTGLLTSAITVVRNSVPVLAFAGENSGTFDFEGQGFRDETQNNQNIVVSISGAEGHIYLTLRKSAGFNSTIEGGRFGSYDNESQVGS